jgi:hypothetical protein
MSKINRAPPTAVNEQWAVSIAPLDVPVDDVANSQDPATPSRVSLASMPASASLSAVPR